VTPAAAFAALGLTPGASPAQVRTAYVAAGKACHPDVGGTVAAFVELRDAYAAALAYALAEPCVNCDGRGGAQVITRSWSTVRVQCAVCVGTGKRHN
jgi:DnaJ-class molecular chaperone